MKRRLPVRLEHALAGCAAILGGVVLLGWLVRATAHLADSSNVDAAGGAWTGLAWYAGKGTLYPPLHAGASFGGTRFMPLPILAHAAAARVTGEYLVSGKLIALVLGAILVLVIVVVLRGARCPLAYAVGLAAALIAGGAGFAVTLGIRFDALPVILQLAAVAVVARSVPQRRSTVAAGVLCALAVLSKLSAVWAALAIGSWLLRRGRSELLPFAIAFGAPLLLGLGIVEAASSGRFGQNLAPLLLAGSHRHIGVSLEVARLRLVARQGLALDVLVVALALVTSALAFARRRPSLWDVALAWSILVVGVVLLDPGAYVNHLVDVEAVAAVALGTRLGAAHAQPSGSSRLQLAAATAVIAACLGTIPHLHPADARRLADGSFGDSAFPRTPLAGTIRPGARVLTENAYVAIARDEAPAVLDPFMLLRLLDDHPGWQRELTRDLDRRVYDDVVLLYRPQSAPAWYGKLHFGTAVIGAIERNYRLAGHVDGYFVYVPRGPRSRTRPSESRSAA